MLSKLAALVLASLTCGAAGLALAQDTRAPERPEAPSERRAPSERPREDSPRRVDVSFEDAPLLELVRYVARVTRRRFILSGSVRDVRVTIISERPVTPAELYDGFLSVLQMHGLTVVRTGPYHRIVETQGIERRDIPVVTDEQAARGG
jgi:general secretion pathway protein D